LKTKVFDLNSNRRWSFVKVRAVLETGMAETTADYFSRFLWVLAWRNPPAQLQCSLDTFLAWESL